MPGEKQAYSYNRTAEARFSPLGSHLSFGSYSKDNLGQIIAVLCSLAYPVAAHWDMQPPKYGTKGHYKGTRVWLSNDGISAPVQGEINTSAALLDLLHTAPVSVAQQWRKVFWWIKSLCRTPLKSKDPILWVPLYILNQSFQPHGSSHFLALIWHLSFTFMGSKTAVIYSTVYSGHAGGRHLPWDCCIHCVPFSLHCCHASCTFLLASLVGIHLINLHLTAYLWDMISSLLPLHSYKNYTPYFLGLCKTA